LVLAKHGEKALSVSVRKASEGDIKTIFNFICGLAEYEKLSHEVVATEAELLKTLFGKDPQAEVLIGSWNATPVGFCLYFYNYSTFLAKRGLYIEDLFVLPASRGHGVGKALLKAAAKIAVERGCGRMEWSVLDWNEPAIRFYRSIGAAPMNEWTVQRLAQNRIQELANS
jgi:GNAT superfamily N-acetyltransferase